MRLVRTQKYEKLSETLKEVADLIEVIPEHKQTYLLTFFEQKRESQLESQRSPSPNPRCSTGMRKTITGGKNRYRSIMELSDELIASPYPKPEAGEMSPLPDDLTKKDSSELKASGNRSREDLELPPLSQIDTLGHPVGSPKGSPQKMLGKLPHSMH